MMKNYQLFLVDRMNEWTTDNKVSLLEGNYKNIRNGVKTRY